MKLLMLITEGRNLTKKTQNMAAIHIGDPQLNLIQCFISFKKIYTTQSDNLAAIHCI